MFFHVSLIAHLTGLALMAGTTVAEMIAFSAFSRRLEHADPAAPALFDLLSKLGILLGIGAGLLVLSGISFLFLTGGIFVHLVWFQVKLGLVALLIINGFAVGSREMAKIKKQLANGQEEAGFQQAARVRTAMTRVRLFYASQLIIFLTIISLSVINVS